MTQALEEITDWGNNLTPNHTYLLEGDSMVAYIRAGTVEPYYFRSPIRGFSRTGRRFRPASTELFGQAALHLGQHQVVGSKGAVYSVNVNLGTCTCPGYTFRGVCKHTKLLETV